MLKEWGDVRNRASSKYEKARASRREAVIREVAGDGIAKAKDNILALRAKSRAADAELKQLGFELDDEGTLNLVYGSSDLADRIEKRLDAEVGTKDEVLTRVFDNARVKLLLVATAEEAEAIVEPLLNFEVKVK
jgi:hypothetical protein